MGGGRFKEANGIIGLGICRMNPINKKGWGAMRAVSVCELNGINVKLVARFKRRFSYFDEKRKRESCVRVRNWFCQADNLHFFDS